MAPLGLILVFMAIAGFAGLLGSFLARRLNEAFAIPRDHWLPWYVSIATLALFGFCSLYLSFPTHSLEAARFETIDRLNGWFCASAVLVGNAVSYFIMRLRLVRAELITDQPHD
ncbi:hypothetical protein [Oceanicaulis sp. MMSF_3324]|uniref:hypothetical protein n=1 Tax=Oceanicaulis sp. MMSF_3324 TaxID=3046702 RepID=UPI00273F4B25|nr:hypothetical protein [Oceanicaulis sp. MMSF_3324]